MRMIIGSAIAATALVGCASPDSVALEHRSELSAQTRGVQLNDDGRMSNVGMFGTTCQVTTEFAMMQDDFDYESETDTVVDAHVVPGQGFTAVVITPGKVNVTTPNAWPLSVTFEATGVLDAAIAGEGFVAIQAPLQASDCNVVWYDATGQIVSSATTLGIECDEQSDMATDQAGNTWVSTDSGVFRVQPDGSVLAVDDTANARLAWDADADALYLAALGSSSVRALELDGALRWEVALGGEITALAHMGSEANAAVSISTSSGGELVVIDGLTGEIEADLPTPSSADALDVSGNGRVLAVTLPNSVHYFDILALQ
ncbi:MAG: hypothetical protein H6737_07435 [Alphaproteobacteria bacterium]|nr:hypothetical protein [Alphaproteobacteria bacterium]